MERYDGKTKRDDYIKYGLITLGVLVVLGLLIWFTGFMKARRQSNPDFTVVVASEEAFNQAMVDDLESVFSGIVGDRNGDGKISIHIEVLRLTDFGSAKQADREAEENYADAVMAGDESAVNEAKFSGLSGDEDFSRMLLLMNTGETNLFLLSEQPRGSFQGAFSTFSGMGFFEELPEELASEEHNDGCDISDAPFWSQLGLEDIPFYACVLDNGNGEEMSFAEQVIFALKNANVTLW